MEKKPPPQSTRMKSSELPRPIEFTEVQKAFQIFKNDYLIVNHPHTPIKTPFEEPNGLDAHGERQYNLTLIPEDMDEQEFLKKLKGNLIISCMDRDAVGPLYNLLKQNDPQTPIVLLSMAGGVIQEHDDRKQALSTILRYISEHQENISGVLATDHDHTCGYIKYALGNIPLAEKLNVKQADPGEHSALDEQIAMKSLIMQNVADLELKKLFGNKLNLALAVIDRKGNIKLDRNFQEIEAKKLSEIKS